MALHPDVNICQECDHRPPICGLRQSARRREQARRYGDMILVTTPDMLDFNSDAAHFPFFAPEDLPPHAELVTARGPFNLVDERGLLETHGIDVIVTKNSGGTGAVAKLDAARALSLPVIMVERPPLPYAPSVETVADTLLWLERHHGSTSSA